MTPGLVAAARAARGGGGLDNRTFTAAPYWDGAGREAASQFLYPAPAGR